MGLVFFDNVMFAVPCKHLLLLGLEELFYYSFPNMRKAKIQRKNLSLPNMRKNLLVLGLYSAAPLF